MIIHHRLWEEDEKEGRKNSDKTVRENVTRSRSLEELVVGRGGPLICERGYQETGYNLPIIGGGGGPSTPHFRKKV